VSLSLKIRSAFLALAVTCGLGHVGAARADTWPSQPITFIVPYAAGGYGDTVARITGRFLEEKLKQTVVIENRPGAGGLIGSDRVAKSTPDGYTFCVCSSGAISTAPVVQRELVKYDPLRDFSLVSLVSIAPQVIITRQGFPAHSVSELIAYAKANPGKVSYSSSGAAGLANYSSQLFQSRTGTSFLHVPFGGGAPATLAVVSGTVDIHFANFTDALPQMGSKTVQGLAITSAKRSSIVPDIPTVMESGVKDFVIETWNAIMAPANTPEPIVRRMHGLLAEMATDPGIKKEFAKLGAETISTTPEEFRQTIQKELALWQSLKSALDKK
jgi:tripartite-type tricarboxylate transporter receptor subunit TctC